MLEAAENQQETGKVLGIGGSPLKSPQVVRLTPTGEKINRVRPNSPLVIRVQTGWRDGKKWTEMRTGLLRVTSTYSPRKNKRDITTPSRSSRQL